MLQLFPVSSEVKQGCVLIPTLFSMMFSTVLADAFREGDVEMDIKYRIEISTIILMENFNLMMLRAKINVKAHVI